jgi:sugar phosphate isomerase/epimerase
MTKIPVGVQLYSVRDDCERDLPGTLTQIKRAGYAGVEFAGYYGYSAAELSRMLGDIGLRCCGAHIGLDQLLGDALAQTIEFHQTLGNKYLVVPWIADEWRSSAAVWKKTAKLFGDLAEQLKPYGMLVGYHNHDIEFLTFDGQTGYDIFYSNTHPSVILQLDIGNAMHGGADPLVYLKRYPGRATTIHLKEYSPTDPDVLLGNGVVPWDEVFQLCESQAKTDWYIVEQEGYPISPMDSVKECLEALRRMGKV